MATFFAHTVLTQRSKNPSNPMCPLCENIIGSPTRLRSLDALIRGIFHFVPNETRENREQILKHRQQEREKWGQRQNTSQVELGGVINQVEDEAHEALPEPDSITADPSASSGHPEDEPTRDVRKTDKRRKRKPHPDRSFELLFVPVLEGYSPTVSMMVSSKPEDYCRVKHSVEH